MQYLHNYVGPLIAKTPLGETECLGNPLLYWLSKHPIF